MGATRMIGARDLREIQTHEMDVAAFELTQRDACRFRSTLDVKSGDVVLIKASFKNACEEQDEEEFDPRCVYRRRVVPFVTRIESVTNLKDGARSVRAHIERITPGDHRFFLTKYVDERDEGITFDFEARLIRYVS